MMKDHEMCVCGHPTQYHEDVDGPGPRGYLQGWGEGSCKDCRCKEFECGACHFKGSLRESVAQTLLTQDLL